MLDKNTFWAKCMSLLRAELDERTINNWFVPVNVTSFEELEKGIKYSISLSTPTYEFADSLLAKYKSLLKKIFSNCLDDAEYDVQVIARNSNPSVVDTPQNTRSNNSNLVKSLVFENFIKSDCNKIAVNIAHSIAYKPGQAPQNVLFLYGPSGVGKTHLCHAIGNKIEELHPEKRVYYIPCNEFNRQYVASSVSSIEDKRFKNTNKFIEFYQSVDVLIIDDIQALKDKEKTQNAFFDIFNHLKDLNKQIIVTCDTPIVDLNGLSERIQTRIQSSIMLEMERPDYNLKTCFLKSYIEKLGITLKDEVSEYILYNNNINDIRKIEGICNTINYTDNDLDTVKKIVCSSVKAQQGLAKEITIEYIHQLVSDAFNIDNNKIFEKRRTQDVVIPRQVLMYLASEYTNSSLKDIARYLNQRTHSNILHGRKSITDMMDTDIEFKKKIDLIKEKF